MPNNLPRDNQRDDRREPNYERLIPRVKKCDCCVLTDDTFHGGRLPKNVMLFHNTQLHKITGMSINDLLGSLNSVKALRCRGLKSFSFFPTRACEVKTNYDIFCAAAKSQWHGICPFEPKDVEPTSRVIFSLVLPREFAEWLLLHKTFESLDDELRQYLRRLFVKASEDVREIMQEKLLPSYFTSCLSGPVGEVLSANVIQEPSTLETRVGVAYLRGDDWHAIVNNGEQDEMIRAESNSLIWEGWHRAMVFKSMAAHARSVHAKVGRDAAGVVVGSAAGLAPKLGGKGDMGDKSPKTKPNGTVSPRQRFQILRRDNFRCQLCGRSQEHGAVLEVDHKIPKSGGGGNDDENLWTLCFECNRGKADLSLGGVA